MNKKLKQRADQFIDWLGKPVRKDVSLRRYTSLSIGGKADYLIHVRREEELILAVQGAIRFKIPYVVIGMGTNILVSDEGFRGLVIRNCWRGEIRVEDKRVWAASHTPLGRVVETAFRHGLTGLEFAAGIPGTIGGALYICAGAFGSSISDLVICGDVISTNGKILIFSKEDFEFDYRFSRLKRTGEIALGVWLELKRGNPEEIRRKMDKILALRASKHPNSKSHNAGSYFKNLPPAERGGKRQAAGRFLELAGAKGMLRGGAAVYHGHANFIVNKGRAKARDVLDLAENLKKLVADKFDIYLEEEVRYLDSKNGFKKGG